jgi:hypothetical protein
MLPIQALLSLPVLRVTIETADNEDWLDSIGYVTPPTDPLPGTPIPLDGISLRYTVRTSADDIGNLLYATTDNGLIQILPADSVSTVNSVWMLAIYAGLFPGFLLPGSYVHEMQGVVGNNTRTIMTGTLVVDKGVSS